MLKNKTKNKNHNKIDLKEKIFSADKKRLKNGSYSAVMSVIFVSVVIVINMVVSELPSKYTQIDVSGQKLYSIGDETKTMLAGLKEDVTIYQVAQQGAEDETIENLLKKYEDESKHIKVEKKDPVVNPKFAAEYTNEDLTENSLIVKCGDRSKIINYSDIYESTIDYQTYSYQTTGFDGEGQITSAIGYVTNENLPVLYTLEGHGEIGLSSGLKESVEKANMQIKSLNLVAEGSVPEDADCLFIGAPSRDIAADEKDALVDYLENGGKAMIFSDYTEEKMENFDAVLANYGLERADGIIFEGDSQRYAMQMPYYILPEISSADAVKGISGGDYLVLAPYAQGIVKSDDLRDSVVVSSLLATSGQAFSKVDLNSGSFEKESADVNGPFDVGVSVTESLDEGKETKLVYYSAASLLDDQVNQMVSGGNEKVVMDSLKWMTDTEETASVSIPSKSLELSRLTISDYDASFWKVCTIGLIPGFFLVAGFVIWAKRRRA